MKKNHNIAYSKNSAQINARYFIFLILFNIFIVFFSYKIVYNNNSWMKILTILTLLHLGINILLINKLGEDIISLATIFVILSYVFHFGQLILQAYNIEGKLYFDVYKLSSENQFKEALLYALLVQTSICIGIALYNIPIRKNKTPIKVQMSINQLHNIKKTGWLLILIGIIPRISIDLSNFIAFIEGGYIASLSIDFRGYVYAIARFFDIGMAVLLIAYSKNKVKSNIIFITALSYQTLVMITGNRGQPVSFIILYVYIYIKMIKKIKLKDFIMLAVLAYFGVVLITSITQYRQSSNQSISLIAETIQSNLGFKPVFNLLNEFGGTLISLVYAMTYFPYEGKYTWGLNYLASVVTIFPNISGIQNNYLNDAVFTYHFPLNVRRFLGGSYMGELYYSFPYWLSIIIAILIGYIIGKISNTIKLSIKNEEYYKLINIIGLFTSIIFWIRSYFYAIVRDFVWTIIIINIITIVLNKGKIKLMTKRRNINNL